METVGLKMSKNICHYQVGMAQYLIYSWALPYPKLFTMLRLLPVILVAIIIICWFLGHAILKLLKILDLAICGFVMLIFFKVMLGIAKR